MKTQKKPILAWHQDTWNQIIRMGDNLPHAILLYGPAGTGKSNFAEYLAKTLLCENRQPDGHACLSCSSCGWIDQYSHPDYRSIVPAAIAAERNTGEDNTETTDTDDEKNSAKTTREPSRKIGIDQIRNLTDVINLSTHRGGRRVICLWPAESLTMESSNAILKMLEEPPPGTIFILVTNNINALLPTILSRCRKLALPMPEKETALAWLAAQGLSDAETWLAEQGGAPMAALQESAANNRDEMDTFLSALISPGINTTLKTAEKLQRSSAPYIIAWMQRWLYDILAIRMGSGLRYFPRYKKQLETLATKADLDELLRLIKKTAERKRVEEHPLVLRLLIEDILLDYTQLFKKTAG